MWRWDLNDPFESWNDDINSTFINCPIGFIPHSDSTIFRAQLCRTNIGTSHTTQQIPTRRPWVEPSPPPCWLLWQATNFVTQSLAAPNDPNLSTSTSHHHSPLFLLAPWVIFLTQSSKGSCKGGCIYNAHEWHWQFNLTHGLHKPNYSNPKSCVSWHHFDVQYVSLVLSDLETYSHQELFKDTLKHLLSPEGDANITDTSMKVCGVWCVKIYGC